MSAFRGSASTDTGRFENKTIKMMNKITFPPELVNTRINMENIELEPFKKWIAMKIETILGIDDDILTNLIFNLLEKEQFPNVRYIYVQLVPFLERHVRKFMLELWALLDSAQNSGTGIPQEMLDSLRQELDQKKKEQAKIGHALEKRYGDENGTKREKNKKEEGHEVRGRDRGRRSRERDRRGRDRDRRHRSRERGDRGRDRRERDRRDRSRDRDRDRGKESSRYEERSRRSKRQPRSPSPPRAMQKEKQRKSPPQIPSPSPPACLKKAQNETSRRSASSDSSSSDSSSSGSDS